jgi:LCP family protein required for cell wall assembly
MSAKQPQTPNLNRKKVDKVSIAILAIFIILAAIIAVIAYLVVLNIVLPMQSLQLPGAPIAIDGQPGLSQGTMQAGDLPLEVIPVVTPFPWDGASRVTILVMGLDYRDWSENANAPSRTDSMMLVTMDPVTKTAGMLSIPRDMWVEIPNYGHAKINTAYFLGEAYRLPGGGPALATATVEELVGVPINFYAQIDFTAFVMFIDEIGGLDINVPIDMVIDPIGVGNTKKLTPGVVTLNGAESLAYARARYTEDGDFDRARRQQQVVMSIRDNILNYYSLPKLVGKAPALFSTLASGIKTNLSMEDAVNLAWVVQQVPESSIAHGVIGHDAVIGYKIVLDNVEQAVLKPIPDKVREVRDLVFANGVDGPSFLMKPPPATGSDIPALVRTEAARISVQSGSQNPNAANQAAEYLRSLGMNIVELTNADNIYPQSEIRIYNSKPFAIKQLASVFGITTDRIIFQGYNPDNPYDIAIIVGNDWAGQTTTP